MTIKKTKRGLQIAFKEKPEGRKFNSFETKDISNVVMHPHDNVVTSFRNRTNYQDSIDTDADMDNLDIATVGSSVSTLDRLLNSPMGCESENHTSEEHLETCFFTCVKCNLKFHDKCLDDLARELKMDSYQKDEEICVTCTKKLKYFVKEHYCSWGELDLDSFNNS